MPKSQNGYKFILVMLCEISNFMVTVPIFTATSPDVCKALQDHLDINLFAEMDSHTPIIPASKKPMMHGFIRELKDSRKLVLEGPHNLLSAHVSCLYPAGRIEYEINCKSPHKEHFMPWTSSMKPSQKECDRLINWKREQIDNSCNGRHKTTAQASRFTEATRPNNPDWRPYPILNRVLVESSEHHESLMGKSQPTSTVPINGGGARLKIRAYLNDNYPTVRAQLNKPCQPLRGGHGPVMQESPVLRAEQDCDTQLHHLSSGVMQRQSKGNTNEPHSYNIFR